MSVEDEEDLRHESASESDEPPDRDSAANESDDGSGEEPDDSDDEDAHKSEVLVGRTSSGLAHFNTIVVQTVGAETGLPGIRLDTLSFTKPEHPSVRLDSVRFTAPLPSVQISTVRFAKLEQPSIQPASVVFRAKRKRGVPPIPPIPPEKLEEPSFQKGTL
jgi:hypothetical protein